MPHYRTRHAEQKLLDFADFFKVVLVLGARQVGKSTLLEHVFPDHRVIVFDPVQDLYGVRADPDLFLDSFPPPLILDEVQHAPELLPALKRRVDRSDRPGQYLLTGSQNLAVLRTVAESMAGRVGVLTLDGLTVQELSDAGDTPGWLSRYLDAPGELAAQLAARPVTEVPLTRLLWRGGLPGLLDAPDAVVPDYYRSYVQTYVHRDVRTMEDIRELASFDRFLGLSAALTAQEINASQLGRDIGVAPSTARRWLDLMVHTYQWFELAPYHGNAIKRLSKKPKGYLEDTGLTCWLQRISSPQALAVSPLLGAVFEAWVVAELRKQFVSLATPPRAWHWRTSGGAEVDLVLERDGRLYPIEIKCRTHLSRHDTRGLRAFRETYAHLSVMPGVVVYAGDTVFRLDEHTTAVPWSAANAGVALR